MAKILILGAGSMSTAFAFPCSDNNHQVSIVGTYLEDNFIDIIKAAANSNYINIIQYNTEQLVSIDFNHNPYSCIFDSTQTRVSSDGKLAKVLAWYDNEWGFSNRMLDTSIVLMNA